MMTFRGGSAGGNGCARSKSTGRRTFLYGNHFSKMTVRGFGGGVGKRSIIICRGGAAGAGIVFSMTCGLKNGKKENFLVRTVDSNSSFHSRSGGGVGGRSRIVNGGGVRASSFFSRIKMG